MKISIVTKNADSGVITELLRAAQKNRIKAEPISIDSINDIQYINNKLGDIIIWRASGIDIKSERASLGVILQDKHVINQSIFTNAYITHKLYQQTLISYSTRINTIPTFRYKNIKELKASIEMGILEYPFISKPNYGSQGKGVVLIKNSAQLTELKGMYADYIFQNFIPNDGDWRIIVIGGHAIGVMKRTATAGSHLNNISQGGVATLEQDKRIVSKVTDIATTVASVFGLSFCGVDVIRNKDTGELFFLEVNTAPEWNGENGFQSVSKVNVAESLMLYCQQMGRRNHKPTQDLVRDYYDTNFAFLEGKQFHYASRMYLWTGDVRMKNELEVLREEYIGVDHDQLKQKFQTILKKGAGDRPQNIAMRKKYFAKYNMLRKYNSILFKVLFAETIYQEDIRPVVKELISDDQFLELFSTLKKDKDAIRVLSTHAINFFYNLNFYFNSSKKLSVKTTIDPAYYLSLVKTFHGTVDGKKISQDQELKLKLYLLTHAIIGASNFYSHPAKGFCYKQMIHLAEELIQENYFQITLDNKVEFLVCAALCGEVSSLRSLIEEEAKVSLSTVGNFLVDKINLSSDGKVKNKLSQAEHRNVLYLMSQYEFIHKEESVISKTTLQPKLKVRSLPILGRRAYVQFKKFPGIRFNARVDSGADFSALH
ncbi:ATP-grasp domain-containing protein, partial [Candidatus Saccharibacteria bacterium]|nr:ATP-grasp domain-containing protein [Candidatus Saccharibacteria bacterium]